MYFKGDLTHNSVDAATRISIALSSFLACKPLAPLLILAFFCARNNCSASCSCRSFRMVRTGTRGSSCSRLFDSTVAILAYPNAFRFSCTNHLSSFLLQPSLYHLQSLAPKQFFHPRRSWISNHSPAMSLQVCQFHHFCCSPQSLHLSAARSQYASNMEHQE